MRKLRLMRVESRMRSPMRKPNLIILSHPVLLHQIAVSMGFCPMLATVQSSLCSNLSSTKLGEFGLSP